MTTDTEAQQQMTAKYFKNDKKFHIVNHRTCFLCSRDGRICSGSYGDTWKTSWSYCLSNTYINTFNLHFLLWQTHMFLTAGYVLLYIYLSQHLYLVKFVITKKKAIVVIMAPNTSVLQWGQSLIRVLCHL